MHVVGIRVLLLRAGPVTDVHMLHLVECSVVYTADRSKMLLPGDGTPIGSYRRTNGHSHSHVRSWEGNCRPGVDMQWHRCKMAHYHHTSNRHFQ